MIKPFLQARYGALYCGDSEEILKSFPPSFFTSMATDPPYGLKFMNKAWDYSVPSVNFYKGALRVLKPGAHALIFAGSRTQHRMAVNVEDAGFQLKDTLMWMYGSGFPKATNISKQIDKIAGKERRVLWEAKGPIPGNHGGGGAYGHGGCCDITAPTTPEAELWDGWKTHLKPAYEPIILAMKANAGSYAKNALEHGVSGINIDGCRIEAPGGVGERLRGAPRADGGCYGTANAKINPPPPLGRFPANVVLDEVAAEMLDAQSGVLKSGELKPTLAKKLGYQGGGGGYIAQHPADSGGASRFFYVAKASRSERNTGCGNLPDATMSELNTIGGEASSFKTGSGNLRNPYLKNNHPTVKPLKLMQYLCRLVSYPGGSLILDPFAGSGTTAIACERLKLNWVAIERDPHNCEIAAARILAAEEFKT